MVSPIERMIDDACKCTKCGGGIRECRCWVFLKCQRCGKGKKVERDETDPARADVVKILCPECNPGDFGEPSYFTAAGEEVSWTEAVTT